MEQLAFASGWIHTWYWLKHVLHSGWLCITSRPIFKADTCSYIIIYFITNAPITTNTLFKLPQKFVYCILLCTCKMGWYKASEPLHMVTYFYLFTVTYNHFRKDYFTTQWETALWVYSSTCRKYGSTSTATPSHAARISRHTRPRFYHQSLQDESGKELVYHPKSSVQKFKCFWALCGMFGSS